MFRFCCGGSRMGIAVLVGVTGCALGNGLQAASVTEIYGFTSTVGDLPPSVLVESGGAFFGTTIEGGPHGDGAAFKFVP